MTYPKDPGHVAGSETSAAGADYIAPRRETQRERVLAHIQRAGIIGVTDEEGANALGLRKASYTARRRELDIDKEIFDSGRPRPGSAGIDVVSWVGYKHMVKPGYIAPLKGKERAGRSERYFLRVILMAAASCQGGHSEVGGMIAEMFDIPFPLTMENLETAAIKEGFDPKELWPWLFKFRADRDKQRKADEADGTGDLFHGV